MFCRRAYGRFLHHCPLGGEPAGMVADPTHEQPRRTVIAWPMVALPGEQCVLWDLDRRVGVEHPWGLDQTRVAAIEADLNRRDRNRRIRPVPLGPDVA